MNSDHKNSDWCSNFKLVGHITDGDSAHIMAAQYIDGTRVVLKCLWTTCEARQTQHIQNELEFARLDCPCLMKYYDAHKLENGWVALELEEVSESQPIDLWPSMSLVDLQQSFLEFAQCIDNFHSAALVHRNIQPSHLLLGKELRMCGFGLSRSLTQPEWLNGDDLECIRFLPPEAQSGGWQRHSDQWAFAKAYEYLRENRGQNLRFNHPLGIKELNAIRIATHSNPSKRFQSCVDFVNELRR